MSNARKVCSVCGKDWLSGWNHSIWCGGFGMPLARPVDSEDSLRDLLTKRSTQPRKETG